MGVGSHSLLNGFFPIQGSNLGVLQCRQILIHLHFFPTEASIIHLHHTKYNNGKGKKCSLQSFTI